MRFLIYCILFLVCSIIYIHILYHLKQSDEENIYDIDFQNKSHLEKICDMRCPFVFKAPNTSLLTGDKMKEMNIELNILKETSKEIEIEGEGEGKKATRTEHYVFSEFNKRALENSSIQDTIRKSEKQYFRPDFTLMNNTDLIHSSPEFTTPLVSNYNYRNFFHVHYGSVKVRFISPIHIDDIPHHFDYEHLHNVSTKDVNSFTHIKSITLHKGDALYIPSFWWYSFEFIENTVMIKYQYRSLMNIVAHSPYYAYSLIAKQKRIDSDNLKELKTKID